MPSSARAKSAPRAPAPRSSVGTALSLGILALPSGKNMAAVRADFSVFIKRIAKGRDGSSLTDNQFSRVFDRLLTWAHATRTPLSIVGPPGIGKSTRARYFLEWRLGIDPLQRMVVLSSSEDLAAKVVAAMRRDVSGPEFSALFPDAQIDKRTGVDDPRMGNRIECFYMLQSGNDPIPAMEAVAVETTEEMRRVDIALCDDIVGREIANSPQRRQHRASAFFDTWMNGRLKSIEGSGWPLLIQNVYHKDDLAHRILKRRDFMSVWFGITDDYDSLFIRVWNMPDDCDVFNGLHRSHKRMGSEAEFRIEKPRVPSYSREELQKSHRSDPSTYDRKFRCIAQADTDAMFPAFSEKRTFPGRVPDMLGLDNRTARLPVFTHPESRRYTFAWGYDMASDTRPGDALVCVGCNSAGLLFPVEVHFGVSWQPSDVVEIIEDARRRNIVPGVVAVENNGVQGKIVDGIRLLAKQRRVDWWTAVKPCTTGNNKMSAELGLPALNQQFASGNFVWPELENDDDWSRLALEFADCPRFPKPGGTGDGVMALWFCYLKLVEGGFAGRGFVSAPVSAVGVSEARPW